MECANERTENVSELQLDENISSFVLSQVNALDIDDGRDKEKFYVWPIIIIKLRIMCSRMSDDYNMRISISLFLVE